MKKSKLILIAMISLGSICLLSGCGKQEEKNDQKNNQAENMTVAEALESQFKEVIKEEKDIEKVARKLSENEKLEVELDVARVAEGDYISGFQTEIKGFKNAVVMRPFIGTIPLIAYVFEVDDAENFANTLKENADLRWNICTEADEMKAVAIDQYVFFIMSPKNFEG